MGLLRKFTPSSQKGKFEGNNPYGKTVFYRYPHSGIRKARKKTNNLRPNKRKKAKLLWRNFINSGYASYDNKAMHITASQFLDKPRDVSARSRHQSYYGI